MERLGRKERDVIEQQRTFTLKLDDEAGFMVGIRSYEFAGVLTPILVGIDAQRAVAELRAVGADRA